METFVRQATKQGAQLVVFPEDAIIGPLAGQTDFVSQAVTYLAACQALAVKYEVDLVPGTWTVQEGTVLYNTAHYINKDGTVAGIYRKINLGKTEKEKLTAGQTVSVFPSFRLSVFPSFRLSVFPTVHGKIGLIISWDISFSNLFTEMVKQSVRLVISPTYWSFPRSVETDDENSDEIHRIDSLCTTRAFENNIVFAYCNAAGE